MRKRKRKWMSFLLIAVMLFAMVPERIVMAGVTEVDTFVQAMDSYDAHLEDYWEAITAYYGDEENGIDGALPIYLQAKDDGADSLKELYEAAMDVRGQSVDCFEEVSASYDAAKEVYLTLDDAQKAVEEVAERIIILEDSYEDACTTNATLAEVPAPDEAPEGFSTVFIDAEGNFDGSATAPAYWKVDENGKLIEAAEDDYSIYTEKTADSVTMRLRNFRFTCDPEGPEGDAVFSETNLKLILEGTNSITATKGLALGVEGNLTITGIGSLALSSVSKEITPQGGEPYIPMALMVNGSLTNGAMVTCSSMNPDGTVFLDCEAKDIINTGTLTVGEGQKISTQDGSCAKLVNPTQNQYHSSADYPVPTDHVYVAKAYYYMEDVIYPNDMYDYGEDTSQWKIVGQYDENGKAKGSHIYYQYWFVDKRGGMLTEDIVNPTQFLVYEDNPEALIKDKDNVYVSDGKSHTFNADLYALGFTKGNVTVNGNVIVDLACFNEGQREAAPDTDEYLNYVWNSDGTRAWLTESTPDSKVTVNGNVGLLSLNDSYIGSVTVNGNIDLIGFYEDMDPSVVNTLSYVPESFYGSKADAGIVVKDGEFVNLGGSLQGYQGYSVYNTEDFYVMTERTVQGEVVHGTSAAIGEDSLLVDVTKSSVGATTYPCVKKVEDSREKQVKNVLTNKESKLVVMDISLIQDNARKVEPQTTVNLSIDNLSGFSKPAVYHVKDNGEIEKLFAYDGSGKFGGSVTCATNSFSTYFVAEDQLLSSSNLNTTPGGNQTGNNTSDTNQTGGNTTDTTQTGGNATDASQTGGNTADTTATGGVAAPQTDDTSVMATSGVLLIIGTAALAAMAFRKKKRMNYLQRK